MCHFLSHASSIITGHVLNELSVAIQQVRLPQPPTALCPLHTPAHSMQGGGVGLKRGSVYRKWGVGFKEQCVQEGGQYVQERGCGVKGGNVCRKGAVYIGRG